MSGETVQAICVWCGGAFPRPAKPRGKEQRFCRPAHRAAFWKAARHPAARAILSGLLTHEAVKVGGSAVYGSQGADKSPGVGAG